MNNSSIIVGWINLAHCKDWINTRRLVSLFQRYPFQMPRLLVKLLTFAEQFLQGQECHGLEQTLWADTLASCWPHLPAEAFPLLLRIIKRLSEYPIFKAELSKRCIPMTWLARLDDLGRDLQVLLLQVLQGLVAQGHRVDVDDSAWADKQTTLFVFSHFRKAKSSELLNGWLGLLHFLLRKNCYRREFNRTNGLRHLYNLLKIPHLDILVLTKKVLATLEIKAVDGWTKFDKDQVIQLLSSVSMGIPMVAKTEKRKIAPSKIIFNGGFYSCRFEQKYGQNKCSRSCSRFTSSFC